MNNLSQLLAEAGDFEAAEPLAREALAGMRETLGPKHRETLLFAGDLARLLNTRGKAAEAEVLCREALGGQRETLGDKHPHTLLSCQNLGELQEARGRLRAAEPLLREAHAGRRRLLGARHEDTVVSAHALARVLQALGRQTEAAALLDPAASGCALPGCEAGDAAGAKLQQCKACLSVKYCCAARPADASALHALPHGVPLFCLRHRRITSGSTGSCLREGTRRSAGG